MGWSMLNKKVAFVAGFTGQDGCWQQYISVPVMSCIPVDQEVTFE
jgi:hypothetical protein